MKVQQGYLLETCRAAQGFLDANGKEFDENGIASARRNLDEAVVQLAAHGDAQDGSARASTGETAKQ